MAFDPKIITRRVLEELGEAELARVRVLIGSKTLREAVRLIINESQGRADLFIPHYWAVYYHDGRGAVSPVNARKLVFFDNPLENDPRLKGRYPVKESQVRRLTKRQYEAGLRINAERRERGERPFMFVVDRVGPAAGHPFFEQLANNATNRADGIVPRVFEEEFLKQFDADPDLRGEDLRADFRLR